MTTDLNKILARQDYVKMTKPLRDRCNKVEHIISTKMAELEIVGMCTYIKVNQMNIFCIDGHIYIREIEAEKDCFSEYRLITTEIDDGASFGDGDSYRNFERTPCSNKVAKAFLNNAVAIIERLGEIEQTNVDDINQAIEATNKL